MTFRADEEKVKGLAQAISYLVPRGIPHDEKEHAIKFIKDTENEYGPVIDSYPTWHPLMEFQDESYDRRSPQTQPCRNNGYSGVDHTICFANAFISCPYDGGVELLNSIKKRPTSKNAIIDAEIIDINLYNSGATTVLVKCNWYHDVDMSTFIPKRIAVGLMLEDEIPQWSDAQVSESWETMRPYLMGSPHGAKSSLFVDQETGQSMKTVWNAIINTGLYGPRKY